MKRCGVCAWIPKARGDYRRPAAWCSYIGKEEAHHRSLERSHLAQKFGKTMQAASPRVCFLWLHEICEYEADLIHVDSCVDPLQFCAAVWEVDVELGIIAWAAQGSRLAMHGHMGLHRGGDEMCSKACCRSGRRACSEVSQERGARLWIGWTCIPSLVALVI